MITIRNIDKIKGMGFITTTQHPHQWMATDQWDGHPTMWIDAVEDLTTYYSIRVRVRESNAEFQLRIHRLTPQIDAMYGGTRVTGWVEPDYDMYAILDYIEMANLFVKALDAGIPQPPF